MEIPRGVKDFLPREMELKRKLESSALKLLKSWGYREVDTPIYEYLEVIEAGAGPHIREELQLMLDREGRILALRPEMTIPIARLVSTKMREERLPLRLAYSANIFRHIQPQMGRYKEFWQLGMEMIGAGGARADAEVIALAALSLNSMGLPDYRISLNHVAVFNEVLAALKLSPDDEDDLRSLVARKDMVGLERLFARLSVKDALKDELLRLPLAQGDQELFDRFPGLMMFPRVREAVDELREVLKELALLGVDRHVVVDLGVLRGLDYYTGVIFEGYSPQLGFALLGGGRYDNLMSQFGWPNPATGFAIGLERVMLCLGFPDIGETRCLIGGADWRRVLTEAEALRSQGMVVEVDVNGASSEALQEQARNCPGLEVIYLE